MTVREGRTQRGFALTEIEFRDYPSCPPRIFQVQESSLVEPRLWVGPPVHDVQLGSDPTDLTHMERAHLDAPAVRALRDALNAWLEGLDDDDEAFLAGELNG